MGTTTSPLKYLTVPVSDLGRLFNWHSDRRTVLMASRNSVDSILRRPQIKMASLKARLWIKRFNRTASSWGSSAMAEPNRSLKSRWPRSLTHRAWNELATTTSNRIRVPELPLSRPPKLATQDRFKAVCLKAPMWMSASSSLNSSPRNAASKSTHEHLASPTNCSKKPRTCCVKLRYC